MKCPSCAMADLVHDTRDLPYTYKSESTTIPEVTGDFCRSCGEVVMDMTESRRTSLAMRQMNDKMMIYFSTDYVFDGSGSTARREEDPKAPLNWYGSTKLAGEEAIQSTFCKHLIFRTSWVYSEYGKNFVKTMLRMGKDKTQLRVVNDQIGGPTYAPDLASAVWTLIERRMSGEKISSGIYHMAGVGEVSWAQFAEEIFNWCRAHKKDMAVEKVEGIPTSEYATPATRPLNSRLDQKKLKTELGIEMPFWTDSLDLCLKRLEPGG